MQKVNKYWWTRDSHPGRTWTLGSFQDCWWWFGFL